MHSTQSFNPSQIKAVLLIVIATGWTGDDTGEWNWKKWSWGECAMGFTVCATDPNRAVISDFGFVHVTTNGGALWQQAYDWQGWENAAGDVVRRRLGRMGLFVRTGRFVSHHRPRGDVNAHHHEPQGRVFRRGQPGERGRDVRHH